MIYSLPVDYRVDMVLRQSPLVISPPVSLGNDITTLYPHYTLSAQLNSDPLYFVLRNFISPPVIDFGSLRVGMARHLLGKLQFRTIITQISRNAAAAKRVITHLGCNLSLFSAPPHHIEGFSSLQR